MLIEGRRILFGDVHDELGLYDCQSGNGRGRGRGAGGGGGEEAGVRGWGRGLGVRKNNIRIQSMFERG